MIFRPQRVEVSVMEIILEMTGNYEVTGSVVYYLVTRMEYCRTQVFLCDSAYATDLYVC
jgi:hypothetical protein